MRDHDTHQGPEKRKHSRGRPASRARRYRPRPAPRRPSRDARLLKRGRGYYLKAEPVEWPSAEEIIDAVYKAPKEGGGRDGVGRNAQLVRNLTRTIEWLERRQVEEGSSAFCASLNQLILGLFPETRSMGLDERYARGRENVVRWLNALQAAKFLQWWTVKDESGAWWRTEFWLRDGTGEDVRHSYTPSASPSDPDGGQAERAPEPAQLSFLEASQAPSDAGSPGSPAEPPALLFHLDLVGPCRDCKRSTSASSPCLSTVPHPLTFTTRREAPSFDAIERPATPSWPATLAAWRTAASGAEARRRLVDLPGEKLLETLCAAVSAGAPPIPALRFAYERLAYETPQLTTSRLRQLERSLELADRSAWQGDGEVGAGACWLLGLMREHYLLRSPVRVPGRAGRSAPVRSLLGWVVLLRRTAKQWDRVATRRRRTLRLQAAGAPA